MDKDVHTEHCCATCGCKYYDPECTVMSGEKKQSYDCEWCEQNIEDLNEYVSGVTRVEVVDENGRSYVNWHDNNQVALSLQDNNRTLKIFINRSELA